MTTTNISSTDLRRFSTRLFETVGMPAEDADVAAASLVESDLRGIYSHGVVRLQPPYLEEMRDGHTNPAPDIKVVRDSAAHALLDGDRGQGQVVSHRAMSLAIDKARAATIGIVGVRNSRHFGAAAYWSMMAANQNMIGFATSNGSRLSAAPFGGIEAAQGNMPMSYAIPNGDDDPVLLDMATGAAAMGKVMMASIRGDSIPLGWAIDKDGQDTTDPDAVTAVLPAGGPKGYGIGVVLDILAGTLTGSLPSAIKGLDPEIADKGNQSGHFFMAINIEGFVPVEEFADTMREHTRILHAVKPRPGFDRVYLPGEIEWKTKTDRLAGGIPFQETELAILQEMSDTFSVPITW
jgi:LDH2 family malate/lactate/ureidoglycolate dehydrogenase